MAAQRRIIKTQWRLESRLIIAIILADFLVLSPVGQISIGAVTGNQEDTVTCAQIGQKIDNIAGIVMMITVDRRPFLDFDPHLVGESIEILDGYDPDIGGVVPIEGQLLAYRRFTSQQQLYTISPVREIGETDNYLFTNPEKLAEETIRLVNLLQGLA